MDHSSHQHHRMQVDADGATMGNNTNDLPKDCEAVSEDYEFTVHAGRRYAADYPGVIFGWSEHEWRVRPCGRVRVTFVNDDSVRHQWMIHGLPKYLYAAGMFHLEAAGGETRVGSFIVPSVDKTYLVHCDMAQHMEKGMKGQLIVGRGSGKLWSVPGVTQPFERAPYLPAYAIWLALATGFISLTVVAYWLRRS